MIHQCCHGGFLSGGARAGELRGHAAPRVGGGAEVGAQRAEGGVGVGVGAIARCGVVPILHHLSGGGGGAPRYRPLAVVVAIGTQIVVVGALVPCGGKQGRHSRILRSCVAALQQAVPQVVVRACMGVRPFELGIMFLIMLNLPLVVVEPPLHMGGHVVCHEGVGGAVAEDGRHTVVGRHDDEALTLAAGKDVECGVGSCGGDVGQGDVRAALGLDEMSGDGESFLLVHGRSRGGGNDTGKSRYQ